MTQIIFNSQEEFEDAVMEVLRKRMELLVYSASDGYRVVMLCDKNVQDDTITKASFYIN